MVAFLSGFWYYVLYQPLFNLLIWLYSGVAGHNLGWAVVWLTIILRVVLLPLSIISEFTAIRRQKAEEEAEKAILAYKGDKIAQKEVVRAIISRYKISPWAKVLNLGIQALVLILLYQVFVRGITGDKMVKILYPILDFPGKINTVFYGFEIGKIKDGLWAAVAAVYLFISILIETRGKKHWEKSEMYYVVLFPLFTFFALYYLPMVKSLFILTTMIFSDIITIVRVIITKIFSSSAPAHH